jgi:hypothetical protein
MPIFRDLEGNFFDIPDEDLQKYRVEDEISEGTTLAGGEVEHPTAPQAAYNYQGAAYTWPPGAAAYNYGPPPSGSPAYNYQGAAYTWPPSSPTQAAYNYPGPAARMPQPQAAYNYPGPAARMPQPQAAYNYPGPAAQLPQPQAA